MKLSPITKAQAISIVKNAAIAGLSAFAVSIQLSNDVSKPAVVSAAVAAIAAVVKTVEKAFTQG